MVELDFGNIYSSSGKIIQARYAQKAATTGSTILAMRNKKCAVLVVAKPISSKLRIHEANHRILKVADNIHMASTGIQTDGFFITKLMESAAEKYAEQFQLPMPAERFRMVLDEYIYHFTEYINLRIIGANFLAIMEDRGQYRVMGVDCAGRVAEYTGYAYGVGGRRAQTEIEKMSLEEMETVDLVDQGIKTLFKCHDPLSDVEFTVEVGIIGEETNGEFVRVEKSKIDEIVEKYKDISIDGEE